MAAPAAEASSGGGRRSSGNPAGVPWGAGSAFFIASVREPLFTQSARPAVPIIRLAASAAPRHMRLQYLLQYRDATEAHSLRFPGDPAPPRPPVSGPAQAVGWVVVLVCVAALYVLLSRTSGRHTPLRAALAEADRIDHPAFVLGVVLTAIGGAMVVVPAAYLLARRRSARPVFDDVPFTLDLDDAGVTLRTAHKELLVKWDGVAAVAETPTLFVLKTVGDLRVIVPARAAGSPSGVQSLREELRRRVVPIAAVAHFTGVAA
jgi:hypothetical protein